jgi:hypothetical protein
LAKTGKRSRDLKADVSQVNVFKIGRKLPLYPRALDGSKAGVEIRTPTGRFDTLAKLSSGEPAAVRYSVGKGEVVLFLQSVDLGRDIANPENAEDGMVNDLCEWAGVRRLFSSEKSEFRMSVLEEGDKRWLLLHRFTKDRLADVQGTRVTAKPTSDNLAQPRLSGDVKLLFLEDDRQYLVCEITGSEHPQFQLSGKELREKGLPVKEMIAKETRIYRIEPLK